MTNCKIIQGDARDVMASMDGESVQTVVTSPPYWGLRDYGTARWSSGDDSCDHVDGEAAAERMRQKKSMIECGERTDGSTRTRVHDETIGKQFQYRGTCGKCGATRIDAQMGLEATPEEYVAKMVEVFREVRRVLRDDGTLWLNLGDSYSRGDRKSVPTQRGEAASSKDEDKYCFDSPAAMLGDHPTIKPKDLIGIPWRVAFALQADGWYLRQDIIWSKPNPMPESVTDRCTKAHEYIFLLTKSQRYYYDAEAVREDAVKYGTPGHLQGGSGERAGTREGLRGASWEAAAGRNKRSVWTVTTKPFSGAHFATFPPDLIEPCIKAGCPKDGTVLDPFGGAGTTGMVADRLGRNAVLIELNADYAQIARDRLVDDCPLFTEIKTEMETDE